MYRLPGALISPTYGSMRSKRKEDACLSVGMYLWKRMSGNTVLTPAVCARACSHVMLPECLT